MAINEYTCNVKKLGNTKNGHYLVSSNLNIFCHTVTDIQQSECTLFLLMLDTATF